MTSQQSPTVWIETQSGSRLPHPIKLGSQVVGRSPAVELPIPSDLVSNHHAELYWDGQRLRIRDLGSLNGTVVNGKRVVDWVSLRDGDVILFANTHAVIQVGESAPSGEHAAGPQTAATSPQSHRSHQQRPQQQPHRLSDIPIFISHSSDDKVAARSIATYLRRAGWTVWIDEEGIAGGKDWRGELVRALEQTWMVVLLVSLKSMRSKWVVREVQAADRLGKQIIPVVVDEAPYPDALRMILGGVQQIQLTQLGDEDHRNQQLARLDNALILAARQTAKTPPGKTLIAVGNVIRVIGVVGLIIGFALFIYLGITEVQANEFPPEVTDVGGIPRPFIGWGVFVVFMIVAGIGEGIRRAGLRKGI
jgi:hypothetical protein